MNSHCQKLVSAINAGQAFRFASTAIANVIGCRGTAVPGVTHGAD